ncbi:MAG: hypothetical protein ACUVUD_03915 [bacterium]
MITLIIFVGFGVVSPPEVTLDPGRSWFTFETDNFYVHFSTKGKLTEERVEFARYLAGISEEVRAIVASQSGVVCRQKVHLVVVDYNDYYNGWATPFPLNTITIFPTPPREFKSNDDDWVRTLILHEYSHILQLEQRQGVLNLLSHIFGKLILPNTLLPTWAVEGYAVYNESRFGSFGRLRSAEWHGMLLQAAGSNTLLGLDRCDGYVLQRYPAGLAPYLYGSAFCDFIARKYGENILEKFNSTNSGQIPFLENQAARKIFGSSFPRLWEEWQNALVYDVDSMVKGVGKGTRQIITLLTHDGYNKSSPCWSKNGAEIYYISATGRERMAIKCLNLGTLESRVLHRGRVFGSLSRSNDGRYLAFTQLVVNKWGGEQSDIFLLDLTTRREKRLTVGERACDPDFAPDSSQLIYVSYQTGQSNLVILNYLSGERRQITDTRDSTIYHHPRFSPGGRLVAVEAWRPGGYADIEIIDLITGWSISITSDRASDVFPAWSKTGKFLFFSSDRTGLFNLYAYSIESRQFYRCTDVFGGVFEAAVAPNNRKIALLTLGSNGYDLSLMELRFRDWQPAEDFVDSLPENKYSSVSFQSQLYSYYPLGSLLPRFWLPWLNFTSGLEVGVFTFGWDVLQFHRYSLFGGYQVVTQMPFLNFNYELLRYFPDFNIEGFFSRREQSARVGINIPFYGDNWFQQSGAGFTVRRDSSIMTKLDLSWRFNSAQTFLFNVAPVTGREIVVAGDAQQMLFQSSDKSDKVFRVFGFWNEYLGNSPATWSLKSKIVIGSAFGDEGRYGAFWLSNSGLFSIRGFPESSPSGSEIGIGGLEFRIPINWMERGIGTIPIFFRNINGAVFLETGLIGNWRRGDLSDWRNGVGGEVRLDFTLARYVPFNVTIGAALGLKRRVSYQVYFKLTSELLASIATNKIPDGLITPHKSDI